MATHLEELLSFDGDYIEPFAGSAVLFFRNKPDRAYLNDVNSNLMNLYKDIREDPVYIWQVYAKIPATRESYIEARRRFNSVRRSKLKSGLFLYLNHYCFNGIYRTNSSGEFNTPFGGAKIPIRMSQREILTFADVLSGAELYSEDFESFLKRVNPENACIYMDPPYFTTEGRVFREYGPEIFSRKDLERLADVCRLLAGSGNRVVVSYQDCEEFRSLFSDSIFQDLEVVRNVGGFKARRKRHRELVAVL